MPALALALRRASWMLCACVLLLPRLAAARPDISIDLDGDGRHDQVMLDGRSPFVLQVWLSKSGKTQTLHSSVPLQQVVAADLDGDHRLELVARGSGTQLHVWKRREHRGFRSYRRRDVPLVAFHERSRRSLDDNDSEPPAVLTGAPIVPFALTLCASPRAPGLEGSIVRAPQAVRPFRSFAAVDPFAPRPPPLRSPL